MSMYDVTGATGTPPPGYSAMLGDTLGPLGMLGAGRAAYGAGKLAVSKIPGLLARYGSSALGSLAGAPMTGAMAGLYAMGDGHGSLTTPANGGEADLYIRDPATGQMVPNPAATAKLGVSPADQALLKQASPTGMTPAGTAPPLPPPMSVAMAPQPPTASQTNLPPQATPTSFTPPAPGPTAPPPNLYNGPGSQNFGMGGAPGGQAPPNPNAGVANIMPALQSLMSGNGGSMFQPQTAAASQSNPMGNILPFIKNLLSGGSSYSGGGE